jgi:hypothetical protein
LNLTYTYHLRTNIRFFNRTAILASGNTQPPLECSSVPGITGAADDIITTCEQSDVSTLNGSLVNSEIEPEFALVTAPATEGGCTVESVVNPTWTHHQTMWQTNFENSTTDQSLELFATKFRTPAFDYWFYGFVGQQNLPGAADPATW